MADLQGRGVVVVGASAGIGRALAVAAVRAGAEVLLTARRQERLAEAVVVAGGGAVLAADLGDEDTAARIADVAGQALPQIDLVIIAAGMAPLAPLEATTTEQWGAMLQTNLVGTNRCIAALVPHLAPAGIIAACSSDSVGNPRWGLGAYAASKAALEESLRGWRNEHPWARFTSIAVGPTVPTEFGDGFDRELLTTAFERWAEQGLGSAMMGTDEVAQVVLDILAAALPHPAVGLYDLRLRPTSPRADPTTERSGT